MADAILIVAVLILSVVIHENAHGWVALALGDTTAQRAGRLTLNPIRHIDPVGSVIIPAFLAFTAGSAFGYAKPVPVNPRNLKGRDRGGFALVAIAGPLSNFVIAFVAVVLLKRLYGVIAPPIPGASWGHRVIWTAFLVNLALAAFNLVPIPPLDGSRLLRLFLRPRGLQVLDRFEPYGFVVLMLLIFVLPQPFERVLDIIRSGLVRLLPL
jgi:Zn-dependent protease